MALKPILKNGQSQGFTKDYPHASRSDTANVTHKHREVAIHHAKILQHRKDVEAANILSLEELMYFPTEPDADPISPASPDLARLRLLIRSFQPSDYDELFRERNCLEKCGYVFCPHRRRQEHGRGKVRLQAQGRDRTRFLSAEHVEMWCSDECARRALFIKVQLDEQPAWERSSCNMKPIQLLDEGGQCTSHTRKGDHMIDENTDESQDFEKVMGDLVVERGEQAQSARAKIVLAERLRERNTPNPIPAPGIERSSADAIEELP